MYMKTAKTIIHDRRIGYKIVSKEDNESAVKQIFDSLLTYFYHNKFYSLNKIIFFGSRKRGDYSWDSDFDFVVVIDEDISSFPEKENIRNGILDKISEKRYKGEFLDVELIVSDLKNFNESLNCKGHILRYANREGIILYDKVLQSGKRVA